MRAIVHPGPVSAERHAAVACEATPFAARLMPGRSVNQAVAEAFADAGFASGYIRLKGAAVDPMLYVMPAPAPDETHAAWYSETYAPRGVTTIEDAGLIVGLRDGEPFLHCHGIWRTPDGERRAGHLLPLEAQFAEPVEAEAWGLSGAAFDVTTDAETNFRLFKAMPASSESASQGRRAIACTIKPNGDIGAAVERICAEHGLADASIHGIGSLIGADFEDAPHFPSYATEVLVRHGEVRAGRATLDIALVGIDGSVAEGRLVRNTNPVCVTFELLLVAD